MSFDNRSSSFGNSQNFNANTASHENIHAISNSNNKNTNYLGTNSNGSAIADGSSSLNLKKVRSSSFNNNNSRNNVASALANGNGSGNQEIKSPIATNNNFPRRRGSIPVSFNTISDVDSRHSDSSNETEEDVCFPMDRENTRTEQGIDFNELQQFIDEQREENEALLLQNQSVPAAMDFARQDNNNGGTFQLPASKKRYSSKKDKYKNRNKLSNAAIKYIPKWLQHKPIPGHKKHENDGTRHRRESIPMDNLNTINEKQSSFDDLSSSKQTSKQNQVGFAEQNNRIEVFEDEDTTSPVDTNNMDATESSEDNNNNTVPIYQKVSGTYANTTSNKDVLEEIPRRFSLFTSENDETIHAHDLPSLVQPGASIEDLFKSDDPNFTWWLNCCCATDSEIKILAKTFGIHPLTAEDIRMSENREKVEFFKDYYFVSFHSFNSDNESEDFLEPIFFYMVVFKTGFLTFHNSPVVHCVNVRRRIRQLRGYVPLSSDWICYALIDDITDSFFPVIQAIDFETDAIEASVFVIRDTDFSTMLHRIGLSRNKVMTLLRLLGSKADVLRMLSKRCHDYTITTTTSSPMVLDNINSLSNNNFSSNLPGSQQHHQDPNGPPSNNSGTFLTAQNTSNSNQTPAPFSIPSIMTAGGPIPATATGGQGGSGSAAATIAGFIPGSSNFATTGGTAPSGGNAQQQPRAEIALYLDDIQDHIITMFQNLSSYEKILSRSYTNYLAQLQVESFNSNNKVTDMLSKVTLIGTIIVPMNVITGLFGMNVPVPGQEATGLGWWFGILGVLVFTMVCGLLFANWWVKRMNNSISEEQDAQNDDSRTFISRFVRRNRNLFNQTAGARRSGGEQGANNRSILSFSNNYNY